MRQPLVFGPEPSPLAKVFSQFATAISSGPSSEERDYRAALAQKTRLEADAAAQKAAALQSSGSRLAALFGDYTADGQRVKPWTDPDTGEVIVNTNPNVELETPAQKAQRQSLGIAQLFADVGKDNADALRLGLQTAGAFGAPDDMRRSMVLGGHAVGPDFSPTAAEADRIRTRNTDQDIRKELAKPRSDSEIKGALLNKNFNNLDKLTPAQQKALGALPGSGGGVSLGMDENGRITSLNIGGASPNSAGGVPGAPSLGKLQPSVQTDMQKRMLATNELSSFLDQYEKLVDGAKDTDFGLSGTGQLLAGDVATQAQNLGGLLNSMGYKVDPKSNVDPLSQATQQARAELLTKGIPVDVVDQLFSGNTKIRQLETFRNLGLFKAASALAGQQGRDLSDKDLARMDTLLANPVGPLGSRARTKQSITDIRSIMNISRQAYGGQPQQSDVKQNAGDLIQQARDAVRRGADPAKVKERLGSLGVTPPSDF